MKKNNSFLEEKFLLRFTNYINEIETDGLNIIEEIEYNSFRYFLPFKIQSEVVCLFGNFYFDITFSNKTYRYDFQTREIEVFDE
jgi:hypothetical protein